VKTHPVHVGQWGTFVRTPAVSDAQATVELDVTLDNDSDAAVSATIATEFYELDANGVLIGEPVASQAAQQLEVAAKASATAKTSASISTPKRWGPPPTQQPNLYAAVTFISLDG